MVDGGKEPSAVGWTTRLRTPSMTLAQRPAPGDGHSLGYARPIAPVYEMSAFMY